MSTEELNELKEQRASAQAELIRIAEDIFQSKEQLVSLEEHLDSLYTGFASQIAFDNELKNEWQRKTRMNELQNDSEEFLKTKREITHLKNYIEYCRMLIDIKLVAY